MKIKQLESALQSIRRYSDLGPERTNIALEQYSTSPHLAARMIFTADMQYGDIEGKVVLDMGCGTGVLGIGAAVMGAAHVVGWDVDPGALEVAAENAAEIEVDLDLVCLDVIASRRVAAGSVDTVVMNPPFGTRIAGADVAFLQRALALGPAAVYSMHKSSTREHIASKASEWGADFQVVAQMRFDIPATYKFHRQKSVDVEVDLVRL
ncbi:unnamed protein product, partial [Phaeothamnion confervicola]